ncbi:MAG: N-acetylmuramoyl-L-alanine amidase family protein [Kiritimatiellia bacterium]
MRTAGRLAFALTIVVACAHGAEPVSNQEMGCWIPMTNVMASLGLTHRERLADGLVLSNAAHTLHFFAGHRGVSLDGVSVFLHLPPRDASSNDLRDVARVDYETMLQPILLATAGPPATLRIVLDAGHGGEDSGARSVAPQVREKDVTLDIARQVAAHVTAAGQQALLTRSRDVTVALGERTRFAAAHQAQLFVSIHANSSPTNQFALGAETYILPVPGFNGLADNTHGPTNACPGNRFDTANALLGYAIHRRFAPVTGLDRGLKRARYYVLKEAPCPAVLVECGFLTNTNDATRLGDSVYRRKLADEIASGILDYTRLIRLPAQPPPAEAVSLTPPPPTGTPN